MPVHVIVVDPRAPLGPPPGDDDGGGAAAAARGEGEDEIDEDEDGALSGGDDDGDGGGGGEPRRWTLAARAASVARSGLALRTARDMCCFYMRARWVMACLQWIAGEKMYHSTRPGRAPDGRQLPRVRCARRRAAARRRARRAARRGDGAGGRCVSHADRYFLSR